MRVKYNFIPTKEEKARKDKAIRAVIECLDGFTLEQCEGIISQVFCHLKNAATVNAKDYLVSED